MGLQITTYPILLLLFSLISISVGIAVFFKANRRLKLNLVLLLVAIATWQIATAFEAMVVPLDSKILWSKISWIGTATVPLLMFIFLHKYLDIAQWLNNQKIKILWSISFIILILAFTNEWHHLIWKDIYQIQKRAIVIARYEYGLAFWLYVVYAYVLLTASTVLLVKAIRSYSDFYRHQTLLLIMAIPFPWLGNILYFTNSEVLMYRDLTPLGFGITGILLAINLYRYHFLDMVPIARDRLVENMDDGLMVVNMENKLIDINKSAMNILDIDKSFLGNDIDSVLNKYPELREIFDYNEPANFEIELGKNRKKYYGVKLNFLSENSNVRSGRIITFRDVTNIKIADKKLRENEERFRTIFNNAGDPIVILDSKTGRITDANDMVLDIFGYDHKEEVQGLTIEEISLSEDLQLSEDEDGELESLNRIKKAREGAPQLFEWWAVDENMEKFWLEISFQKVDLLGSERILGILRDITKRKTAEKELKEKEARYRAIFENTGNATCIIEEDTTLSFINKKFEELSGYPKEEIEGKMSWTVFVYEKDLEKMKKYHKARRQDPSSAPSQYEFRFMPKSGNLKDVLLIVDMIPGSSKSVASLLDVTEKRKLEEQLQQTQKLDSVGNLAAGIAHDFNNILTVIQGNTQIAEMKIGNQESPLNSLANINKAAERAGKLTEQLLLFSRKQSIDLQPINLNQIVNNLLKMLNRLINEDISIVTDLAPELNMIKGDRNNIEQVIMNLVLNARDAMPDGGKIYIRTANLNLSAKDAIKYNYPAGKYTELIIEDTGMGIEEDLLDQIFDPFFTTKSMADGAGMGLSVAYGIIKKHEGYIDVASQVDKGTRFKIILPCIEKAAKTEKRQKSKKGKNLKGNNEWILYIEDEPEVVKIGKTLLTNSGYQVDAVMNAKDALQKFRKDQDKYDLILSDVVLPDMNGMDLVDNILNIKDDLAVILCSGYTDERSKRNLIRKKNIPFIQKPFNMKELLRNIKEVLRENSAN
jgi:PAS domain S-box-containing protein